MAHLKLMLLGGFEAASSSGAAVTLPTKKARALLAYCALRPGKAQQREKLATLLWGETSEQNARNSLRQALFLLRAAMRQARSAALRIDSDTVTADPQAIDVDVLRFEQLVAKGAPAVLEQAVTLYRGDLLDGFVIDEEPFEQWLLQERERLREQVLDALARLLRHQDSQEATEAAIQTARRLLALDPLQEAVHRMLMRLHVSSGRREAALRQYEVCVGLLRRELQLGPEPETRLLHEEILRARERVPPPIPDVSLSPPAKAAPVQTAAEKTPNGVASSTPDPTRRLARHSSDFSARYPEEALAVRQPSQRARAIRLASVERRIASRKAMLAAQAQSAQAVVAARDLTARARDLLRAMGRSPEGEPLGVSITFEDRTKTRQVEADLQRASQELETAYEELQSTNEALQTTNEELQSTVEELETANEELQSTNEEHETMNEELQSTNSELQTINVQLRSRTEELNRSNTLLEAILASLVSGAVAVDLDLHVLIWNRRAEDMWGLRSDEVIGQPLASLDIGLPVAQLLDPLRACIAATTSGLRHVTLDATDRRGRNMRCRVTLAPLMNGRDLEGAIMLTDHADRPTESLAAQ